MVKSCFPDDSEQTMGYEYHAQQDASLVEVSGTSTCGICFCSDEKAVRGRLDTCDHYFCFICIMEWAKVESRCPLCKRRFGSIRRLPKEDVFSSERVISVPKRDQVFVLDGNSMIGPEDPYANTQCGICQGIADENLLLLCDLCDSAAHTYCAGLGHVIPEGDWFCHDCTIAKQYHLSVQSDNASCRMPLSLPSREIPVPLHTRQFGGANGNEARRLTHCHNAYGYICSLRENWEALRDGSVMFPASMSSHGTGNSCSSSTELHSAAPAKQVDDVTKSWRLMELAQLSQSEMKTTEVPRPSVSMWGPVTEKQKHLVLKNKGGTCNLGDVEENKRRNKRIRMDLTSTEMSPSGSFCTGPVARQGQHGSISTLHSTRSVTGNNYSANNEAKRQIQPLVKLNLKILSAKRRLEADQFRKIARCATHTILATCGFECSKNVSYSYPGPTCHHSEETRMSHASLMKNACKKCFFAFVGDVVNSLMRSMVSTHA